ncbi:hypothetical protein RchiOBHm_Chr2g0134511 [Rosa chinensis]|uniref:Uncharacterized protein n=1 Tax=Rosa chinensis TaxID=74649 RepID=A0A2P6RVV2_ROSCH|nr:hypothetical protein RchiOBHm_Chr2g0134511 [Rosa chinensis]
MLPRSDGEPITIPESSKLTAPLPTNVPDETLLVFPVIRGPNTTAAQMFFLANRPDDQPTVHPANPHGDWAFHALTRGSPPVNHRRQPPSYAEVRDNTSFVDVLRNMNEEFGVNISSMHDSLPLHAQGPEIVLPNPETSTTDMPLVVAPEDPELLAIVPPPPDGVHNALVAAHPVDDDQDAFAGDMAAEDGQEDDAYLDDDVDLNEDVDIEEEDMAPGFEKSIQINDSWLML